MQALSHIKLVYLQVYFVNSTVSAPLRALSQLPRQSFTIPTKSNLTIMVLSQLQIWGRCSSGRRYIYLSFVTWPALSQLRPPVFSPCTHLPSLFVLVQVEAQTAAGRLDHRASGQQSARHKLCGPEPWIPTLSQRRVIINLFNLSSAVTAPFSQGHCLSSSDNPSQSRWNQPTITISAFCK